MERPDSKEVHESDTETRGDSHRRERYAKTDGEFQRALAHEREIMGFIVNRFQSLGGMTPAISKEIGWTE